MAKYKYKIAEEKETFSATEVDPTLIQRVEKTYGPVDMKYDFFSADLKTYFKTKSVDPETGSVDSQVIKLASFTDSLEKLYIATEALSSLVKSPGGKDDAVVVKSYDDLKTIFNNSDVSFSLLSSSFNSFIFVSAFSISFLILLILFSS